jgi:hypothetical protein
MSSTEASVWHAPINDADGYLPEGPREFGDRIVWVNIQTGPDATTGDVHVRG